MGMIIKVVQDKERTPNKMWFVVLCFYGQNSMRPKQKNCPEFLFRTFSACVLSHLCLIAPDVKLLYLFIGIDLWLLDIEVVWEVSENV